MSKNDLVDRKYIAEGLKIPTEKLDTMVFKGHVQLPRVVDKKRKKQFFIKAEADMFIASDPLSSRPSRPFKAAGGIDLSLSVGFIAGKLIDLEGFMERRTEPRPNVVHLIERNDVERPHPALTRQYNGANEYQMAPNSFGRGGWV